MRVTAFAVVVGATGAWSGLALGQQSVVGTLRAAERSHPGDSDAAFALGRALRRAGQPVEASTELRKAAALGQTPSEKVAAYEELARVYDDAKDFYQAMSVCRHLGSIKTAGASAHVCAAQAHFVRQRAAEALSEVEQAQAIDPRSYAAKVAEGRARELELDVPRAEAALREAIAIDPGPADAHLALGRLLWGAGRRAEGLAEVRRAVEIDPEGPDGLFELSRVLGQGNESMAALDHAVRERPSFADAWRALGVERLAAGQLAAAEQAGRVALRLSPNDAVARVVLGQVALAEGRVDEADRAGRAALKVVPNSAAAELLIADANAKKGDIDLAVEAYQKAWGLDHADPSPLVRASEACHAAGRDTSARAFGVRATEEFPAWAPAWRALGDALAAQGEKGAAREAYEKALMASEGKIERDVVERKLAGP